MPIQRVYILIASYRQKTTQTLKPPKIMNFNGHLEHELICELI